MSSEKILKGKTVIVTGGASGIGFAIAQSYLERGVKSVALIDINPDIGKQSAENLNNKYGQDKVQFIEGNVTSKEDRDKVYSKLVHEWKNVDVLVNNAGVVDENNPDRCIAINLTAYVNWTIKFWQHMRLDKGGRGGTIVNISSTFGFRPDPLLPVYVASKCGIFGFTRSLGGEYHYVRTGVRIIALCPSITHTNLKCVESPFMDEEELQKAKQDMMKTLQLQFPQDVAKAAVDLFETAESGNAWCVENIKSIYKV